MTRKEGFALKHMRRERRGYERSFVVEASPPIPAPQHRHHLITYFLTITVCSGLKTSLDVLYQGPTPYFNDSDSTVMEGIPVAAPHLNHAVILASGSVQIMMVALTPGLTAALERWLEVMVGGCARVGGERAATARKTERPGVQTFTPTFLMQRPYSSITAQKQRRHLNVVVLGFHPLQVFLLAPKWLLLARGRWVVGHGFGLGLVGGLMHSRCANERCGEVQRWMRWRLVGREDETRNERRDEGNG
ncbi:hypothetical protein BJ165DRAFT_1410237 [Panaeolus papilionaceus]|nr:hypothetical protein BJ165DRAFT_1410237 [Panaeolus papilionaceus]